MSRNKKEYKVPSRRQPIYSIFKIFMRMFFRKPKKIINASGGEIADKAIVLSNYSAKSGPPALDMYYPKFNVKWGAHEMFGNYKERRAYLRDILYIKKCKKNRFHAAFMATILAVFNPPVYKGMKMIPTYTDYRLRQTIKDSIKVLDANASIMIFPENSNEGYKEVLTKFFPGFVMLAERYYKLRGEDLPVYPMYYHVKKRIMVIGEPIYVQDLIKQGMDRYEIAEFFCQKVNDLFAKYIKDKV